MARGRNLDSLGAGQEQLPIVSIFLVLFCMVAALNTYAHPSASHFKAVQSSLKETFHGSETDKAPKKASLYAQAQSQLNALCAAYSAKCTDVETLTRTGTLIEVPGVTFDADGGGLSSQSDTFLRSAAALAQQYGLDVSLGAPKAVDLQTARLTILSTLLERYMGVPANLVHAPGLVQSDLGLILMPGEAT